MTKPECFVGIDVSQTCDARTPPPARPAAQSRSMGTVKALITQPTELLRAQIAALDTAMRALVPSESPLSQPPQLKTVPECGFVTTTSMLAETQSFQSLHSRRQLEADAGIALIPNDSGAMIEQTPISKTENAHWRRSAHLAAVGAMECKDHLSKFIVSRAPKQRLRKLLWWP